MEVMGMLGSYVSGLLGDSRQFQKEKAKANIATMMKLVNSMDLQLGSMSDTIHREMNEMKKMVSNGNINSMTLKEKIKTVAARKISHDMLLKKRMMISSLVSSYKRTGFTNSLLQMINDMSELIKDMEDGVEIQDYDDVIDNFRDANNSQMSKENKLNEMLKKMNMESGYEKNENDLELMILKEIGATVDKKSGNYVKHDYKENAIEEVIKSKTNQNF